MKLGILISKAKKDFIIKGNCSICVNGIPIEAGSVVKSKFQLKRVYLCRSSLKFPKCRWLKKGFKLKD